MKKKVAPTLRRFCCYFRLRPLPGLNSGCGMRRTAERNKIRMRMNVNSPALLSRLLVGSVSDDTRNDNLCNVYAQTNSFFSETLSFSGFKFTYLLLLFLKCFPCTFKWQTKYVLHNFVENPVILLFIYLYIIKTTWMISIISSFLTNLLIKQIYDK